MLHVVASLARKHATSHDAPLDDCFRSDVRVEPQTRTTSWAIVETRRHNIVTMDLYLRLILTFLANIIIMTYFREVLLMK